MLNHGIGEDAEDEDEKDGNDEQAGNRSGDPPFLRDAVGNGGENERHKQNEHADLQQILTAPDRR